MHGTMSAEAIETARALLDDHLRLPDGTCRCGSPWGPRCRKYREYAVNLLKVAKVEL